MPIYTQTPNTASTIDLIQTINRGISGVRRAPPLVSMPTQINTADLPFVVTWIGDGTSFHKGLNTSLLRMDRTYRIIAFVAPLGQSIIPDRATEAALLLQHVIEAWLRVESVALADPDANGGYQVTLQVSETQPIRDSGLRSDLMFGGVPYHGFEVSLPVRELWTTSTT
jgi:hypothetical protein